MVERPHPTAALIIFPANQTPRFWWKAACDESDEDCTEWPHAPWGSSRQHNVPSAAVPTHGLRFSITLNAFLPLSRSSLAFLAIYQLTTLAARLTRALFW